MTHLPSAIHHPTVVLTRYWVFPGMDKRLFVECRELRKFDDGIMFLLKSCHHKKVPPRRGHAFGHNFHTGYHFKDTIGEDGNPVAVCTGISQMDYGGSIPQSCINLLNKKTFREWMELLLKTAKKRRKAGLL